MSHENEHMLARLAAAERRIKHLESYCASLERGAGSVAQLAIEPPFVKRLRELDQQDEQERPK
jgi:hypothetical protein